MSKLEVIAIVGATAVGKTALSLELAKKLNGEIINGDSMQVYKRFNIGTAKITKEEMSNIPHHLFDIKEPMETFSVAEFQQLVRSKIADIQARGKLPIIVGGTGLYIQSVLFDYQFTEQKVDEALREQLYAELEKVGPDAMHAKLAELDAESAAIIHPNNTRRVIRAIEIALDQGTKKSSEQFHQGDTPLYKHLIIGLDRPREQLYDRINKRVNVMMQQGFLQEVRELKEEDIVECQAMSAIGYRELLAHLNGEISLKYAIEQIQQNSRKYAKRQLTYFRNKLPVTWVDATLPVEEQLSTIEKLI